MEHAPGHCILIGDGTIRFRSVPKVNVQVLPQVACSEVGCSRIKTAYNSKGEYSRRWDAPLWMRQGLPITTAIVLISNQLREGEGKLTGFFVRKETKKHGLQKKIERYSLRQPLIVVDDDCNYGSKCHRCRKRFD